jgi:hypothetical protein
MSTVVVELQGQLLVWERDPTRWEDTLMAREDDLASAERALGKAHMECDVERDWAEVVQQDNRARLRASTTGHRGSLDFDHVLCERQFVLSVWETDLERREEKMAKEQTWGLYSFDGSDLSAEMEKLHEHVARVKDERTVEAVQLSWSIMEISDALVDLGVFPIRDIPAQL